MLVYLLLAQSTVEERLAEKNRSCWEKGAGFFVCIEITDSAINANLSGFAFSSIGVAHA